MEIKPAAGGAGVRIQEDIKPKVRVEPKPEDQPKEVKAAEPEPEENAGRLNLSV